MGSYEAFAIEVLTNDSLKNPAIYGNQYSKDGPVQSMDLFPQENGKEHHTDMFHSVSSPLKTPILRRGQLFSLQLTFKQPFKIAEDNLRLDFMTGPEPTPVKSSLIQLKVTESPELPESKDWGVRLKSKTDTSLMLEVRSSAAAPVGFWQLKAFTKPGNQWFYGPQHFYLIFNPWCKDDAVYMENDQWREEYVLNEHGIIFRSSQDTTKPEEISQINWGYNQFSAVVLPTAILLLEKGKLQSNLRANPVDVSRMLTRMSPYVLEGRWSGDYSAGTYPWVWQTSNAIMEKYMADKDKKVVKYGQCWVFGGILNSLCRALGLPSRLITCFGSAHDVRQDLTLDIYIKENQEGGGVEGGGDSSWNYHVWNDAWMTRPDLPDGYGGWQAIDATPQLQTLTPPSFYECGPASLEAILKGEIGYVYDTQFVFTEVNADCVQWMKKGGVYVVDNVLTNFCGRSVLTKAVGKEAVHDVTSQYKYKEGTQEERLGMYHAAKVIGMEERIKSLNVKPSAEEDIFFNLQPVQYVMMGGTVSLTIQVENRTNEKPYTHTVCLKVGAQSVTYTGVKVDDLDLSGQAKSEDKLYKKTFQLKPGQKEIIIVQIPPSVYNDHMSDQGHVRIVASGLVKEINQEWFKTETIMIMKPKIIVQFPPEVKEGTEFSVTLKFKNPLPKELTDCLFIISSGCMDTEVQSKFRNIQPNEDVTQQVKITLQHPGSCLILALFISKELNNVTGAKSGKCI